MSLFRRTQQNVDQTHPRQVRAKASTKFKPGNGDSGTFRVLPRDEAFIYPYHYLPGVGYRTCTKHLEAFGGQCVYCHYSDRDAPVKRVLEVLDFNHYHLVPGKNADWPDEHLCASFGPRPRANSRCKWCQNPNPSIQKRHFGGHRIWELSETQFSQLWTTNDKLGEICAQRLEDGSVCGGDVITDNFTCPSCEGVVVDDQQTMLLENAEMLRMRRESQTCPHCGTKAMLIENQHCDAHDHQALPACIFDKRLVFDASGVEKTFGGRTVITISYQFDRSKYDFSDVIEDLAGFGITDEEQLEKLLTNWDLRKRYRPERINLEDYTDEQTKVLNTEAYVAAVLSSQAKALKKQNPFRSEGGAPGNNPFGGTRFRS